MSRTSTGIMISLALLVTIASPSIAEGIAPLFKEDWQLPSQIHGLGNARSWRNLSPLPRYQPQFCVSTTTECPYGNVNIDFPSPLHASAGPGSIVSQNDADVHCESLTDCYLRIFPGGAGMLPISHDLLIPLKDPIVVDFRIAGSGGIWTKLRLHIEHHPATQTEIVELSEGEYLNADGELRSSVFVRRTGSFGGFVLQPPGDGNWTDVRVMIGANAEAIKAVWVRDGIAYATPFLPKKVSISSIAPTLKGIEITRVYSGSGSNKHYDDIVIDRSDLAGPILAARTGTLDREVHLSWFGGNPLQAEPGATYRLYRSASPGTATFYREVVGAEITDVVPKTGVWYYSVARVENGEEGARSAEVGVLAVHHRERTPNDAITGAQCQVDRIRQGAFYPPCPEFGAGPSDVILHTGPLGSHTLEGMQVKVFSPDPSQPGLPRQPIVNGPSPHPPEQNPDGCIGYESTTPSGSLGTFYVCTS